MNLVIINGAVHTMDYRDTLAEAVAIQDGRIVAIGSNDEVKDFRKPGVTVIDAKGKTVLPGFIEPHNHLAGYATSLLGVDATTTRDVSIRDVIQRLRERAQNTPPGEWILARGFDQSAVAEMRFMTNADLDEVTTDHPVFLSTRYGHVAMANSYAMRLGEVHSEMPDPAGGRVYRYPGTADPNGVLGEMPAQDLVTRHIPAYTQDELRSSFIQAVEDNLKVGVTSVQDAAVSNRRGSNGYDLYNRMYDEGHLKLRVNMFIHYNLLKEMDFSVKTGDGDEWLRVAGCKIVSDGSIQGVTGALRSPYWCDPNESAWLIYEQEELNEMVLDLHRRGNQVIIHANGDAAIDEVLNAYEYALAKKPDPNQRFRVEHCQMCWPDHINRMRRLNVIPNYFANHIYYWGDRHRDIFLGPDRGPHISPVGAAIRAGLRPLLHSDSPVTPVNPLMCVQSAVSRMTDTGDVLMPELRAPVQESLRAVGSNAAFGAYEERLKGSLELGKLGDVVVLEHDPFVEAGHTLSGIDVAATIVGGQVMYASKELSIG